MERLILFSRFSTSLWFIESDGGFDPILQVLYFAQIHRNWWRVDPILQVLYFAQIHRKWWKVWSYSPGSLLRSVSLKVMEGLILFSRFSTSLRIIEIDGGFDPILQVLNFAQIHRKWWRVDPILQVLYFAQIHRKGWKGFSILSYSKYYTMH